MADLMQAQSTRVDACSESAGRHPNSEVCLLPGTLAPTIPWAASRKLESLRRLLLHASWGRGHDTTTGDVREAACRTDAFAHRQSRGLRLAGLSRPDVRPPVEGHSTARLARHPSGGRTPTGRARPTGGRRQATSAWALPEALNPPPTGTGTGMVADAHNHTAMAQHVADNNAHRGKYKQHQTTQG